MRSIVTLAGAALVSVALAAPAQGALQCGDTITQDRKLKKDLVDCPFTGVNINGDGVTLDMNGHAIRGTGDRGIQVISGSDNVTIKDGEIRQAANFGFFSDVSNDLKLINLEVISSGGRGIHVDASNSVTVRKTEVRKAGAASIRLSNVSGAVLRDVAVAQGAGVGVDLVSVSGLQLENASVIGSETPDTEGILVEGTSEDNEFSDILLEGWAASGFLQNTPGDASVLRDVTSRGNENGFEFADGLAKVRGALATGSGDDGLLVSGDADVQVTGGRFNGNNDEGIQFLDGTTGAVGDNVANNNDDTGILVPPTGVTDLGGNSATGNGIANCVNVSC